MTFHLNEDENLLFHTQANLFRGIEGVGGDLRITDRRICFNPHPLNIQKDPEEIPLKDIQEVNKKNTLGIFPNGIQIVKKDGTKFHFVVNKRNEIILYIEKHMGKTNLPKF